MKNKEYIMNRVQKHYDYVRSLGFNIVGVFLQGSQNYNLDLYTEEYISDVDTKCIIIPTLKDLIEGNRMTSTKVDFEGEQIDIKDIRLIMDIWAKQNQSYLEILFTNYYILNPLYEPFMNDILNMRDQIVKMNIPRLYSCINGMAMEKMIALEHPYPSTIKKIEDHGFDEKQLCSLARLADLMFCLFNCYMNFGDAIYFEDNSPIRDYMINLKLCKNPDTGEKLKLEEAREYAQMYCDKCEKIKNKVIDKYGKDDFNDFIFIDLQTLVYRLVEYGIISTLYRSEFI